MTVAVVLVATAGGYGYLRYQLAQVHRVAIPTLDPSGALTTTGKSGSHAGTSGTVGPAAATGGPFNVLVVGEDGQGGGMRADTMIVARIDPVTGRASLLSIPYDYFGPVVGGNGPNKISDALAGGPADMVATVEHDLGIPIQHYVQVDFQGVASMVDALGGVRLRFPYPSRDTMSGLSVPKAGCVLLNGKQALALVRSRYFSYEQGGSWHYDGSGAFGRITRQQAFLRAAVRRVQSSLLGAPLRLNDFVSTAVTYLTVDKGLGVGTLLALAQAFHGIGSSGLATFTLPTQIVNNDGAYGDVLYPVAHLDTATIAQWDAAPATGTTSHRGARHGVTGGAKSPTPSSTSTTTTRHSPVVVPGAPQAPLGSIVRNRTVAPYDPTPC